MTDGVTRTRVDAATLRGERLTAYAETHPDGVFAGSIRNDDGIDIWIGPNRLDYHVAHNDAQDALTRRVANDQPPQGETQ